MTLTEKIKIYAHTLGLSEFGVCKTPDGKIALVFLFPYYVDNREGNISLYARSVDYHVVAREYLNKIAVYVFGETQQECEAFCDVSPYDDRKIAFDAGLGFYGKNRLLINPRLGSFFFIGYLVSDSLDVTLSVPLKDQCLGCGACERSCPGGALSGDSFCEENCASYLSQKKGELSPLQEDIILHSDRLWGCDKCQTVCPHNRDLPVTALPEFKTDLTFDLPDVSALSEREFSRKYKHRAFSWRGKKVIERNVKLQTR